MYVPPGVVSLGKTVPLASAAANTPTISWTGFYQKIFIYHFIAGYGSGGGIATLQFGNATTPDTGANYSSITAHFVAGGSGLGTTTSRVNQTGVQVANDSTNNGRRGLHEIWNTATEPKMCDLRTNTYTGTNPVSAGTAHATFSVGSGNWWNTAGPIQCVTMTGGGVNLNAGSYIDIYGLPGT